MENNIVVKLSDSIDICGNNPIVIIGPNGSGKTILGTDLAKHNGAEYIAALRNISSQEEIPMVQLEREQQETSRLIDLHKIDYWRLQNDIEYLFMPL